VDTEKWKVSSLDLRENLLFGELQCVLIESLRQVRAEQRFNSRNKSTHAIRLPVAQHT
jgi:hypothetical protein